MFSGSTLLPRYCSCALQVRHEISPGICIGLVVLIFIGMAAFCEPVHSQPSNDSEVEYRIKAAFIFNFTKFVTFPDDLQGKRNAPITLCILGDSPFGKALDSIREKKVHGHPIKIIHVPNPDAIPSCHIIFFGDNLDTEETEILRRLRTQPVLTVGEKKGFASWGGMINFIMVDNKVRFEINPFAIEAASLKISSQLLKLAVIVETEKSMEN